MPKRPGELYGALVTTDRAKCDLISIDPSPALVRELFCFVFSYSFLYFVYK